MQKANYWVSYAGRCYLVAPEHIRGLAPDEVAMCKPLIREGLEQLKQASKSQDFIDVTQQDASPDELQKALEMPAGNDLAEDVVVPPTPELEDGVPVLELPPETDEEMETTEPQASEVKQLEDTVQEHVTEPIDTETESDSPSKRTIEEAEEPLERAGRRE